MKVQDRLVLSMWWPHYVDILHKDGHSFWTHSDRMWKCLHKYYVFMVILPTSLRGFVPAVHTAILMVVYGLRCLQGQVVSESEAENLGVEPGSRVIDKASIPYYDFVLLLGLVLLEGSCPVASLNPIMHHFVHYGSQTARAGILGWLAMWSFERNNKKIKKLVRNARFTLASLAKNVRMDIATRFDDLDNQSPNDDWKLRCTCYLSQQSKHRGFYMLSRREKFDLGMLGVTSTDDVRSFDIAFVLGVHFRAGEWGQERCGSVITTMFAGRSRYCFVRRFLRVQGQYFALVNWLSISEYPYAPNRLIVKVHLLSREQQLQHRCVISIKKIDPCTVAVLPHEDDVHFYMLRDKGYDRVPSA